MSSLVLTIIIILLAVAAVLIIFLSSIEFKKRTNAKVPENGINECTYLNVNGTRQWINIYGKDLNNPVLLYLHGGPGMSTSMFSYAITRKWTDVYTVVTWDQRNCGKSYSQSMDTVELSNDIVMSDAMTVVDYVRERLHKDKITLLGHSWGSLLGAYLVLEHPERFEAFIGTGQLIDLIGDEERMLDGLRTLAKDNKKDLELVGELESATEIDARYFEIRNKLLNKYGQNVNIRRSDMNLIFAVWCNPYYSTYENRKSDYFKDCRTNKNNAYQRFISSEETIDRFSLKDVKEFPIPYYNINGEKDFIADHRTAQEFFDGLDAPAKKMYILKDTAHGTMIESTEKFSKCVHDIAEQRR